MNESILYVPVAGCEQDDLQTLLLDILGTFINLPIDQVEEQINGALRRIGLYVGADRLYIFKYNFKKRICTNTHEWCAPGVAAQIEQLQATPFEMVQDWIDANQQGRSIHIPDVKALPTVGIREVLEPQGIKTILAIPLIHPGGCIGFVGFDWVRHHHTVDQNEHRILEIFARMLTNVTLRQRADREMNYLRTQLLNNSKLDAMGRMAGGVAHDFGNLITVIHSHNHIAMSKIPPDSPAIPHLKEIQVVAERSSELTRRLMAFARKQDLAPAVINLNGRVAETIQMLRHLTGKNIVLTWEPGEDIWPVRIDPGQLMQILTNLCINARDAIVGAGGVRITTANIQRPPPAGSAPFQAEPRDYVVISVTDSGSGMDKETLDQIFEPFFTTKTPDKGTGLGLPTVFSIVTKSGGFVEVNSEPGLGSTFNVYLPRVPSGDTDAVA